VKVRGARGRAAAAVFGRSKGRSRKILHSFEFKRWGKNLKNLKKKLLKHSDKKVFLISHDCSSKGDTIFSSYDRNFFL
jgi:hypothetical protein